MSAKQYEPDESRQDFRSTWRIVTWAGTLGSVYYILCISGAPRIKFLTELNATALDFGLIASLASVALVFQVVGGLWTQRLVRRKAVWMALAIAHRLAFSAVLMAPVLCTDARSRIYWIIGALFLHDAIAQTSVPLWLSWMADLVPQESITRHWATRQRFITVVNIAVMIGLGFGFGYFEQNGLVILGFSLLASLGLLVGIVDICMFAWVPEPPHERAEHVPWRRILTQPLRDREFRGFLLFMGYWHFAVFFAAPFFGLYMIEYLHFSARTVQLLGAVYVLGVALSSRFWGVLCDAYGFKPVLRILSAVKALTPLAYLVIPRMPLIAIPALIALMFLDGAMNSGVGLAIQGVLLKRTPRRNRTMYIGATNFLSMGVMAAIAPILAGKIIDVSSHHAALQMGAYEFTGYHAVFAASVLMRLGAAWLARGIHESKTVPVKVVLRQLASIDAIRAGRLVYRLQEAAAPAVRRDAAERLGRLRSPLAIVELVHCLDDAAGEVREAAAEALGLIGVAEAAEPLAQALFNRGSGIQSPAAEALGRIGSVDSLRALIRNLSNRDPASLHGTIDALAQIGNDAAILPLISLFHELDDDQVREHVAAALSRLTQVESIEEVVNLLHGRRPVDQLGLK